MEKYIQYQFWKIRHAQNIIKIIPNERRDNFPQFLAIFALFKLKKGIIFGIFILDMLPKLLLDALNIHVIYFRQKKIIFIFIF